MSLIFKTLFDLHNLSDLNFQTVEMNVKPGHVQNCILMYHLLFIHGF